jgi:hypothetical protein
VGSTATENDTARFTYIVPTPVAQQDPPAGTEPGINYIDDQTIRLSLYAPNKQVVHVIGDFNNWAPADLYQMKRSLDGNTWWIEIGGLQAGEIYRFQYLVNGAMKSPIRSAPSCSTPVTTPSSHRLPTPTCRPTPPGKPSVPYRCCKPPNTFQLANRQLYPPQKNRPGRVRTAAARLPRPARLPHTA